MKKFNITGVCIPNKNYMVNVNNKIDKIINLIEDEEYFTINRARQYGKTTVMNQLYQALKDQYLVISISFEGLGDYAFSSENEFCDSFINLVSKELQFSLVDETIIEQWESYKSDLHKFEELSKKITNLINVVDQEVIIMIDEVDKSSDNQLFLHFIGMLRTKYLARNVGRDQTFKSVILAGVYDVKNLKLKIRNDNGEKYNSPWNIAADFDIDMFFNPYEISTMLLEYEKDYHTGMNIEIISNEIYKYTSGYPFLVSKLCKIIDEKLEKNWILKGIEDAVKILLQEKNTLFDDLIKNVDNHEELYHAIYNLIVENENIPYNMDAYQLGIIYSIFKNNNGRLAVHNKIFEIRLYNYMIAKKHLEEVGKRLSNYTATGLYENEDGTLDIKRALIKYQEYMKTIYGKFDKDFIERQGRLLLLAFFKPVINGKGFYFVESQTGFEQRQDVVITYGNQKYIIELKIWRGEEYHKKGIVQLQGYMEIENANEGYLVIYNKNEDKEYKTCNYNIGEKEIFMVWV